MREETQRSFGKRRKREGCVLGVAGDEVAVSIMRHVSAGHLVPREKAE